MDSPFRATKHLVGTNLVENRDYGDALQIIWCERGDSNPHGFTRQILSSIGTKNQWISAVCTERDSPVFMRVSRSAPASELNVSKPPLGTKLGTVTFIRYLLQVHQHALCSTLLCKPRLPTESLRARAWGCAVRAFLAGLSQPLVTLSTAEITFCCHTISARLVVDGRNLAADPQKKPSSSLDCNTPDSGRFV
jgi:hypothetical protein